MKELKIFNICAIKELDSLQKNLEHFTASSSDSETDTAAVSATAVSELL